MTGPFFRRLRRAVFIALTAVAVVGGGVLFAADALCGAPGGWFATIIPREPAAVHRTFRIVLVCGTEEERARGLQGFRKLAKGEAALFLFERAEPVSFWMGSVSYSIDIIFVDSSGTVVRVFSGCRPGSREYYDSGAPAARVLETAAGSGIQAGDRMIVTGPGTERRQTP